MCDLIAQQFAIPLETVQRFFDTARGMNFFDDQAKTTRELFEEFRFTGLSNFSFLEMDFANAPPAEVPVGHE